jgi:predicted RNA-binding protein
MDTKNLIDETLEIINRNELNILNPVMKDLRVQLDNSIAMAVLVCDGSNTVTVSLKLVIEDVLIDQETGEKSIIGPEWSCKVSTKTDIFSDKSKLQGFITRKDIDGCLMAIYPEDKQVTISDLPEAGK